jgi:hypothetical protein
MGAVLLGLVMLRIGDLASEWVIMGNYNELGVTMWFHNTRRISGSKLIPMAADGCGWIQLPQVRSQFNPAATGKS